MAPSRTRRVVTVSNHVSEARAHLAEYEHLSDEERIGALNHAIAALKNERETLR